MQEILLSKTSIYWGKLPKTSFVNKDLILTSMLDDHKHWKEDHPDIKLTYSKHHTWVLEYIIDKLRTEDPETLGKLSSQFVFGNVEEPGHTSIRRDHYTKTDLPNSAGLVGMYFLNGSGELLIENDNPPDIDRVYHFDIEPGRFVVFNSNLTYMRTKNKESNPRGTLVMTLFK